MTDPKAPTRRLSEPAAAAAGGAQPRDYDGALPWSGLLVMALTGFLVIVTETLPAGLLPEIAADLAVGEGAVGQLVGLYAIGTVVAAVPAVALTRRLPRKPVFIVAMAGFVVANTVTAVSGDYVLTLLARFVAGAFSGLLWGMMPGYALGIAGPRRAGRALAVAMIGIPLALAFGTPLGTFAGTLLGWRWTFVSLSVVGLALIVWMQVGAPDQAGESTGTARTPVSRVLWMPGIRPVLVVVVLWMLGHNLLYTYIAPFLSAVGVDARVDVTLLVFGVSALIGIWATGLWVDRVPRRLVLGSLALFAVAALTLGVAGSSEPVLYATTVIWGLSFGGASTLLNTAAADAAGPHTDTAASLVTTAWNLAILGGSAFGAVQLSSAGARSLPTTVLVLALVALGVALASRRHAFVAGPRGPRTTS